jgi:hypothetical protein
MVAVAIVALVLAAAARCLRPRQAGSDRPLGADRFSRRLAGARLSQQEAIQIAEKAHRGRGADPSRCEIGWVRFDTGKLWSILFDHVPSTPGGSIILIDDITGNAVVIPGE